MNIQELQFVAREKLPMTIIVINNSALGMIRHFQEMNFDKNYTKTTVDSGYTVPDFGAVAKAYGLDYQQVNTLDDIEKINFGKRMPLFVEVCMPINTYLMPKFNYGRPNQDQSPEIDRDLYNYLMEL